MITFKDWIFSRYPAGSGIEGAWGALHIVTLLLVIGLIVAVSFLRGKSERLRRGVIILMASVVLLFELSRRVIWFFNETANHEFSNAMRTLLPRPWCAISCWFLIFSAFIRKKFLYNYTAITGTLCALIFFAYPTVGFNNKYLLFENWYSICTHSLLLAGCISMMTLGLVDFQWRKSWKEAVCLAVTFLYGFLQIFVLKIEKDPLYFMPNNEIQEIVGFNYPLYLIGYLVFLGIYFSSFYAIKYFSEKKKQKVS